MSGQEGLVTGLTEEMALPPAESQIAGSKKPEGRNSIEERWKVTGGEKEVALSEEEEEMTTSAHFEPNTLPWPGDKDNRAPTEKDTGVWSEKGVPHPEDTEELCRGGRDLSKEQSQPEDDRTSRWRQSMPEGERWRDDDDVEMQRDTNGDGSLADDDEEEEEEEEEGEGGWKRSNWIPEKAALSVNPQVTIVRPSSKELPEESRLFIEKDVGKEHNSAVHFPPEWTEQDDKFYLCEALCSNKLRMALATGAAGLLFPLLVWGAYVLLPFDPPLLVSSPLRVVYTLRCSFFGIIPVLLGVVVQGVARVRYSVLKPLYQSSLVNREVAVHQHFVNESLALFLFYFLQLAVMATYVSQDLLKLVPLLTIIFVFGRLIYWLCLSLGSSIRGLGFGFSFFPILVMLGTNLYFVCSSVGQEAIFEVEPPTMTPPPKLRWWG
ncbi:transmembrane protein 79-like [Pungitius pungitius]|uniref:transmembrane protein 79-like n=1 Tax=Pungitius pungitius TaxID=134920 RepID=UPI002E1659D6